MRRSLWSGLGVAGLVLAWCSPAADSACCYFSAKDKDILQPAQKVFITWDPVENVESFTVQPKFEGNALDFGMVIPTPSRPKLDEMPRDFFKELAVYTILKKREQPESKLLPRPVFKSALPANGPGGGGIPQPNLPRSSTVKVLEAGIVGSLDYKIISAERAGDLFQWLKDNKYSYAGDEGTLDFYIQKKWLFTVMKIDTMQMKRNPDGSFAGEVTPTRFQFASEKLIYPLKIGVAAPITLRIGGRHDNVFSQPVRVSGRVAALSNGMTAELPGRGVCQVGRTALVECAAIRIVLMKDRSFAVNHPLLYMHLGIDMADAKIVVVKTASNFQFFARWRKHLIRVDTPGMTQSDLSQFRWQHLPRPIDPFDEMADWKPDPLIGRARRPGR
jgi:hypothetical protein